MEPYNASGHGGDVYRNQVSHDFSINLNPLGMPQGVKKVLKHSVDGWARYPDPECEAGWVSSCAGRVDPLCQRRGRPDLSGSADPCAEKSLAVCSVFFRIPAGINGSRL